MRKNDGGETFMKSFLIYLAFWLSFSGCGSIIGRDSNVKFIGGCNNVYIGLRFDVITPFMIQNVGGILLIPLCLLDLPLSFALDTCLLPLDLIFDNCQEIRKKEKDNDEAHQLQLEKSYRF